MSKKYSILNSALVFYIFLCFCFLLLAYYSVNIAVAQVRDSDVSLTVVTQYPNPNQDITATISSYVTDLNKTSISWLLNNQEMSKGIGMKSFRFRTGAENTSTILSVIIDTIDGQNVSKSMVITSTGVDMLYEAYDAYVPPFYKGKALTPKQGTFKVVAMPNVSNQGGKINPANISYTWIKDGTIINNASGWGKNYYIFQNSYLDKENTLEVKISDIEGRVNASSRLNLRTVNPKILFYRFDPILGKDIGKALNGNFDLSEKGETIIAEPFFFSPKNLNSSDLNFEWYIGGEKIRTPDIKNILSLKPQGESGNSIIKAIVSNSKTLFQKTEKQINVNF